MTVESPCSGHGLIDSIRERMGLGHHVHDEVQPQERAPHRQYSIRTPGGQRELYGQYSHSSRGIHDRSFRWGFHAILRQYHILDRVTLDCGCSPCPELSLYDCGPHHLCTRGCFHTNRSVPGLLILVCTQQRLCLDARPRTHGAEARCPCRLRNLECHFKGKSGLSRSAIAI